MQRTLLTALLVALSCQLLAPVTAWAEVVVRRYDGQAPVRPPGTAPDGGTVLPKVDEEATLLLLPAFAVDADDPGGRTTLLAVRNVDLAPRRMIVQFLDPHGALLERLDLTVGSEQTYTKNVRDLIGRFPGPHEGLIRGFVQVSQDPDVAEPYLVGDFFQVDVAGAFATGDRLLAQADLCEVQEVRILDFGSGSELTFFVYTPHGADPDTDPPTLTAQVIEETGVFAGEVEVFTDQHSFVLPSSELTDLQFGTLIFDFEDSGGGVVMAEYSADGLFSVGINAACRQPGP